jgi:hypothetical protein
MKIGGQTPQTKKQSFYDKPSPTYQTDDLFAERFSKVSFRDYQNNTRLDIKNVDFRN